MVDLSTQIKPGLVSVTLKHLSWQGVIQHAYHAGLQAIEWHARTHVPAGDLQRAYKVTTAMKDADLQVAAYGSYYVMGAENDQAFNPILETAQVLGAPMVRVWVGNVGLAVTSREQRRMIIHETKQRTDQAAAKGIGLVFEFHRNTLNETGASCVELMQDIERDNVWTYWQPMLNRDVQDNLADLQQVLPWLVGLHIFHWGPTDKDRHPLAVGMEPWQQYLAVAQQCDRSLWGLLEFVQADSVSQLYQDTQTLRELLSEGDLHGSV